MDNYSGNGFDAVQDGFPISNLEWRMNKHETIQDYIRDMDISSTTKDYLLKKNPPIMSMEEAYRAISKFDKSY